ncbi:sigma-70 family RNA polymerase sigma factor [Nocardioides anomalus]|uniref:Sigma-70 family RNA polymerase sigma factor n=1 Tax=Nocardioides anomalus TaxID=2712223 RepID=A0A6G6WGP5_9ACTN|nr:sigma-70 family RNA polymerase sigma factor [Nocardioides anomalus]QIG44498.1 sigma-70 family RNA polymerase sigma factor [Nocardioides anomalus]
MTQAPDDDARARFEALAAEVAEPVRRFLARRTDPDTADDVLAETLLVCWRRLDQVPDPALPWVYGVARNCLANEERSGRRQWRLAAKITVVDPPQEAAPADDEGSGAEERVAAVLATMRPEEAELLRLWAWEQLGPSEIAAVLGLTPNAVSIRLHRARGKFKDELRKIERAGGHEAVREGRDT